MGDLAHLGSYLFVFERLVDLFAHLLLLFLEEVKEHVLVTDLLYPPGHKDLVAAATNALIADEDFQAQRAILRVPDRAAVLSGRVEGRCPVGLTCRSPNGAERWLKLLVALEAVYDRLLGQCRPPR